MTNERPIERIDLDTLLKCLNALDGLETLSIAKGEKPDFTIICKNKKIGIEHTRAVQQEIVRADKLHFAKCPTITVNLTDLKDREPRRSNEEILESMTNPLVSWKKSAECNLDWKNKIAMRLKSKRKKFNQANYQTFDENWLLIHDFQPLPSSSEMNQDGNWMLIHDSPPLLASTEAHLWAGQHLKSVFSEAPDVSKDFDTIFVHSGQCLYRWHNRQLHLANRSTWVFN